MTGFIPTSGYAQAVNGGLQNAHNLSNMVQSGYETGQRHQLAKFLAQGDYENATQAAIKGGLPGQGLTLSQVPYNREKDAQNYAFNREKFGAQQNNSRLAQALRERVFEADQSHRAASLDLQRQGLDLRRATAAAAASGQGKFTTPFQGVDEEGNPGWFQANSNGDLIQLDGVSPNNPIKTVNTKTEQIIVDGRTGAVISRTPIENRESSFETEIGKAGGKAAADAVSDLPRVEANATQMVNVIDGILSHPSLDSAIGQVQARIPDIATTQGVVDFRARAAQLQGKAFLEAFQSLKGGGQITEVEGQKATDAIARLQQTQSEAAYKASLNELRGIVRKSVIRARKSAQKLSSPRLVPGNGPAPTETSPRSIDDLVKHYGG